MIALYRNEALAAASLAKQYASAAACLAQSSQPNQNQNNQSYNTNTPSIPTTLMNMRQQNNNVPNFLNNQNFQSMFPDVRQQNTQMQYQGENTPNKRQKNDCNASSTSSTN